MREVVVLGVGMTKFGISDLNMKEMFVNAAREALEESRMGPGDIQGLFAGNVLGDYEEGQGNIASFLAAELGLSHDAPAIKFESACASATVAVRNAALMVAGGVHDVVIAGGVERTTVMDTPLATKTFAMGGHAEYEAWSGITFPGVFAMVAHMYAAKYGMDLGELKKCMAEVAVKNHANGAKNPKAQFQKEITADKVLSGMVIADPLQLLDCCPFSDGAAAVILAAADKYKDHLPKPVTIAGMGQGSAGALYMQKDITRVLSREASIKQAYSQAGIGPQDVDVCELHDCFTIAEIIASEALGFFEFGQGAEAARQGETALNSKISINPSGGLKAKGHPIGATGAAQVYEIVKQLRQEAGARQVDGANIGLVDTLGGDFSTVCNLVLRRN